MTHGTVAGYHWHVRHHERACDACQHAHAAHMQRWRDRRNPHRATARVSLLILAELLDSLPAEARHRFADRLGDVAERARELRSYPSTPRSHP